MKNLIRYRHPHWCVLSRDGRWVLSKHATHAAARMWKGERLRGASSSTYRHLHLMAATGTIRTAMLEDKEHLVVPVVALVEGVLFPFNAAGPELVLSSEFEKTALVWNQKPVTYDHPYLPDGTRVSAGTPAISDAFVFGRIFGTRVEGKRLLMDVYIDPERAERVGAGALVASMRSGAMAEVSVGVLVREDNSPGTFGGQDYVCIWREIHPDHLALLPAEKTGACSNDMGCGAPRAAMGWWTTDEASGWSIVPSTNDRITLTGGEVVKKRSVKIKTLIEGKEIERELLLNEGVSDIELRGKLEAAIRAVEPGFMFVDTVYPDDGLVVYCVMPEQTQMFLRRGFSVGENESVKLSGDAEEVVASLQFVPADAAAPRSACSCHENAAKEEEMTPEEKQKLDALSAEIDALRKENAEKAAEAAKAKEAEAVRAKQAEADRFKALEEERDRLKKEAEANAVIVAEHKKREAEAREGLLKQAEVSQRTFTRADLEKLDNEQLTKLIGASGATVAAAPVSFVAAGGAAPAALPTGQADVLSFNDFNTRVAESNKKSA